MSQQNQQSDNPSEKNESESCVPFFDALWFCYSPVYQMKEYYVYGTVDDCTGHWGKLMDCLKKKTIRYKDDVPLDPNAGKHPLWTLRTTHEAEKFWENEFSKERKAAFSDDGNSSSRSGDTVNKNRSSDDKNVKQTMV